jgi:hypothetical protein
VFAVCLSAVPNPNAAAEGSLYPHAERESGPWGYIDKTGKIVIPLQFEAAQPFSEGLAAVKLDKKFGFIDSGGRMVIQPRFDWVRSFQSGRASVKVGNDWGFIDSGGAEVGPMTYAFTQSFSGSRAPVGIRGTKKTGVVDLSGQLVIAPEFDGIASFSEGVAKATRDGKFGYIDLSGMVVAPFEFDRAFEFQNGRALARREATKQWGFIDKTGAFAALPDFDLIFQPSEGLSLVVDKQRRNGVIDTDGRIVVPPQFAHAGSGALPLESGSAYEFREGLLPVSKGDGFGYIDRQGTFIIQPQFVAAGPFQDGMAVVQMRAKVAVHPNAQGVLAGVIDRSGKLIAPPIYDRARQKPGGLVQVKLGKRLGYLDSKGRPLTFTDKDIDAYLAEKREPLKPPPPGRAVVGTAGDTTYYLRLPEGICLLDSSDSQDRKVIADVWSGGATVLDTARKKMPQLAEESLRELQKTDAAIKANSGVLTRCDLLDAIRSGADRKALSTYAMASGLQKDRYDPTGNAALVYMVAFMCRSADKDSSGLPGPKDNIARIWNAFRRLEAGESTLLPALASEALACYSAAVMAAEGDASAAPQAPAKAKVGFHTMLVVPDWLVQIFTQETIAATPEALLQLLEQQKALVRAFEDANLKKPAPSTRP